MKSLQDYRIYNNLVFLIPVFAGLYIQEPVFTILAVLILIASTSFHLSLESNKNVGLKRLTDIFISLVCYLYLFYFVTYIRETMHVFFYVALAVTLGIFILGKRYKSDFIHAVFHASIALTAGAIAIF